jgi:hypothetical protein
LFEEFVLHQFGSRWSADGKVNKQHEYKQHV